MGATDTTGRLLASIFRTGPAAPAFSCSLDVRNGGVLLGLPGLLGMGLLAHTEYFVLAAGYYRLDSIFLLLAFMALARIKTIESLRYCPPGEWGKLLGLDRIPEAKTLRRKVRALTSSGQGQQWASALSRDWMAMFPETTGVLYVDGHVRVYTGGQTELPRHYVARQQLCLRATTDYWVNAMDGQPFFMVNRAVDPGLLSVLEEEIVPRLERELPGQRELFGEGDVTPRFTLVFDREGYSPDFMARMREKGIACLTYSKYPGDDWPVTEFARRDVRLASGQTVTMQLAERGTLLGRKLWVREVRKLSQSGHQTAIIATDVTREITGSAAAMFARWSQENFFKYMREHYSLDRLADYSTEEIPDSTPVVNPQYREVDGEVRKQAALLARKRCECDSIHCARIGGWSSDTLVDLFSARRTHILDACGLDGTRANLRLLGKLRCERFTRAEYLLLLRSRHLPGYAGLGHLRALDFRLLAFFLEHPSYTTSRLFRSYDHDWPWAEFSRTRADAANMAGILGLGDMDDRMAACRDMDQLVRVHDRLVVRLNREKAKRIELVVFPEPPDPGTEHIKPIRDSRELACEGMSQHHCVASYQQRILAGRYYVYSVTAPERATLGIKLAENGEMTVDQLKLRYNRRPSAETQAMVEGWLAEVFRRRSRHAAGDG